MRLEELGLLRHRLIDECLYAIHSTLDLTHVKTTVDLRRKQFVGDVERGHDRDPLESDHFSAVANIEHLLVEIVDGFEQAGLFLVGACDAKLAPHDRDLKALRFAHGAAPPSSSAGICASSASSREVAELTFSSRRLL